MRDAVYRNRRRIRGRCGQQLLRRRGEYVERPNAHLCETGGLRRTHLRGHINILKRVLIHTGGFNLGLIRRRLMGVGTPRGLQGRVAALITTLLVLTGSARRGFAAIRASARALTAMGGRWTVPTTFFVNSSAATFTLGC